MENNDMPGEKVKGRELGCSMSETSSISAILYFFFKIKQINYDFPHSSVGKVSACDAGNPSSIPGSGRFPGEGYGNPLQYSCLGNPMDRGI